MFFFFFFFFFLSLSGWGVHERSSVPGRAKCQGGGGGGGALVVDEMYLERVYPSRVCTYVSRALTH